MQEPVHEPEQLEVVSLEDRREVELQFLKLQNLDLQRKVLIQDLEKCGQMMIQGQAAMEKLKGVLSNKYGIDMEKDKINPDGTIERGALKKAG